MTANVLWIQLVVADEHTEAVIEAAGLLLDSEVVIAGVMDAARLADCPTVLEPTSLTKH